MYLLIAGGRIGEVVGDVVFQCGLRLGLCCLETGWAKATDPAFDFVDGAAGHKIVGQLFGINATDGNRIQTLQELVLLVAGIHRDPGIGSFVDRPTRREVIDRRFDPDMFHLDAADLAYGADRDAALHFGCSALI